MDVFVSGIDVQAKTLTVYSMDVGAVGTMHTETPCDFAITLCGGAAGEISTLSTGPRCI